MVKIETEGQFQQPKIVERELQQFLENIKPFTKKLDQLRISHYSVRRRGNNQKIGLSATIISEHGITHARSEGWNELKVLNQLFAKIEKQIKKKTKN